MEEKRMAPQHHIGCDEAAKSRDGAKVAKKTTTTKTGRILSHLLSGKPITPLDALRLYGSFRLSGVVFNLRAKGYDITRVTVKCPLTGSRYAKYSLKKTTR